MAALAAGPVLSPLPAETLTVAAASSLASCLDDLHAAFTSAHPKITVQTTLGASGTLFAQITHGAPFDVFLSADMTYPAALIQSGLAEGPAPTAFAEGRIALWTLRDSLDLSSGLPALTKTRSIAIAQPEYAPYGIAARKALERAGLWDTLKPRIVYGENIAQTAHFVASGNADAGIVASSVLHTPAYTGKGNYKLLPSEGLVQGAVLTRRARDNPAATTYIEFLTSPAAQKIFIRFGFSLPD
jgi:molybdate transport system substrate-binding protein